MNIFKTSEKKRKKIINELINSFSEEKLMEELIDCGLEVEEDKHE